MPLPVAALVSTKVVAATPTTQALGDRVRKAASILGVLVVHQQHKGITLAFVLLLVPSHAMAMAASKTWKGWHQKMSG